MTRYSQWCAEDLVMCALCFGCTPLNALWIDPEGGMWDVCVVCQMDEAYALNQRWPWTGRRPV